MTTAVGNSEVGTDTLIGLSAGADLTSESLSFGRITVIAGGAITESEFALLPLDAVFVRSLGDFESVGSSDAQTILVTKSGFPLAAELLGLGALSPDSAITWSLHAPLNETLKQIGLLGLPERIAVNSVLGTVDRVVVRTVNDGAGRLDLGSFHAGFAVSASLLGQNSVNQATEPAEILQELNVLRTKHLSLLEVLVSPLGRPEDMRKLENELMLLENRYDALHGRYQTLDSRFQALDSENRVLDSRLQALDSENRVLDSRYHALESRYHALANSRLGKLTLRLWARKTSRANKLRSKEGK